MQPNARGERACAFTRVARPRTVWRERGRHTLDRTAIRSGEMLDARPMTAAPRAPIIQGMEKTNPTRRWMLVPSEPPPIERPAVRRRYLLVRRPGEATAPRSALPSAGWPSATGPTAAPTL